MEKILSEKFFGWPRSWRRVVESQLLSTTIFIQRRNYLKSEKNSKGEPKVFTQEQLDKCEKRK